MLSGKVICGCCGGAFSAVGKDYLACSKARRQDTCGNKRSIQRPVLESMVLDALKSKLMAPEHVAAFAADFIAEWNSLQANLSADRDGQQRELAVVQRKLDTMMNTIADGTEAMDRVRDLIERVVVRPGPEGIGLEIELEGALGAMLSLGHASNRDAAGADHGLFERSVKVVAGIGFEPMTFRL